MTAIARAKVNLTLHVTGRRATDGYHLLDSLVVFPDIGDRLTARPADELTLSVLGPYAGPAGAGADNLVLQAAHALQDALAARRGLRQGAALVLEKRLPVASGVGGGSPAAATALILLNDLWGAAFSSAELASIGLRLGADIPVCLAAPATTWMRGVGEQLAAGPSLPPFALALVNPGAPVATPAVFKALSGRFSAPLSPAPEAFADLTALTEWLDRSSNDLEAPARALAPEIDAALAALQGASGRLMARLSGSGATCWGLFAHPAEARAAAEAISAAHPAWWTASGAVG
ncbi:MAG: 4-(cytidine 5'-diphospho)-2-C-methyl-D-erythritol kinase [Pseudomonadota bacterium]